MLRLGELELDRTRHEVRRDGVAVDCTPKEFALLETLMAEPGPERSRPGPWKMAARR